MIKVALDYVQFTGYTSITIPVELDKHKLVLMIADRHEVEMALMSSGSHTKVYGISTSTVNACF